MEEPITHIIMVEGYMDVISLYQAGVRNAMATMGTALTDGQARLLKRYSDKVIICYDGDSAGQKATLRGLDILYGQGLDVRVMSLPNKQDPDDFVREHGKDGFNSMSMKAMPLIEYKLTTLASGYNMDSPEDKGKYAVEAMKILKQFNDPALVAAYVSFVSNLTRISESVLNEQLESTASEKKIIPAKTKVSNSAQDKAIRFILYSLFGGVDNVECDVDLTQYIFDKHQKELYNIIRSSERGSLNLEKLVELEKDNPQVDAIIKEGSKISDDIAHKYFKDCLASILKMTKAQKLSQLTKEYDKETDEEVKKLIMTQIAQLTSSK